MVKPAYSLKQIQQLAASRYVELTQRASREAFSEYRFSVEDVCSVIEGLTEADFYKCDLSRLNNKPLDAYVTSIYSIVYGRHVRTYIKFQVFENLIVVSFHSSDY